MLKKLIYCDYNATTPLNPDALEAMGPYFFEIFGNASSMHTFGQRARKGLEDSREKIASLINAAKPEEIIFTAGGTESNNTAIKGVVAANNAPGVHVITSSIEHHSVLYTCQYLEKHGCRVTYLPVDKSGIVNPDYVHKAITPQTALVTIMHANNEVGTVQPISEIASIIKEENERRYSAGGQRLYFHTDAVQTAGKIDIDVQKLGVDLLSISAHKFYGPKGVGALYCKQGTAMEPLLHGGHHERNMRSGTENIPGIAGMARALELAVKGQAVEQKKLQELRDRLEKGVLGAIEATHANGHPELRLAGTTNITFRYIEGESLLLSLDLEGIAASTGSACASGSVEPSHVLRALGVPPEDAQGSIRFSLGHYTTSEDIDYILEKLPKIVKRLREMSPLWVASKNK